MVAVAAAAVPPVYTTSEVIIDTLLSVPYPTGGRTIDTLLPVPYPTGGRTIDTLLPVPYPTSEVLIETLLPPSYPTTKVFIDTYPAPKPTIVIDTAAPPKSTGEVRTIDTLLPVPPQSSSEVRTIDTLLPVTTSKSTPHAPYPTGPATTPVQQPSGTVSIHPSTTRPVVYTGVAASNAGKGSGVAALMAAAGFAAMM
ncbi:hypothetical protein CBER1_09697 [Cercospora berteroae]|uniref:Uncharacterized protein n=1 Tax=Cercospora berteroae TaxID=357750 RepID=A0A2S6BWU2_9PEZI|nr:hypothetical protein CBER1_09697 [Cercospora berteroae]